VLTRVYLTPSLIKRWWGRGLCLVCKWRCFVVDFPGGSMEAKCVRRMWGSLAVVVATLLFLAPGAGASWYLSQTKAESLTRQHLHYDLEYHYTAAVCRPQGLNKADPRYDYHRWVCTGAAGDQRTYVSCLVTYLIVGSHVPGQYYRRTLDHRRACPYGT
jgi:hypothetical protein